MKRYHYGPPWYSSYVNNNYGELFYALMRVYQPEKVVELGTKAGYSAHHIARGLRDNGKGTLDCYDLWEHYEFHSVAKSDAENNLLEFKDIISLKLENAYLAHNSYREVDVLHVDIGNDGEVLERIIPRWIDKVRQIIIIEGGSSERDKVEWMTMFKKRPIRQWLGEFVKQQKDFEYFTIEPFPSLTILCRG